MSGLDLGQARVAFRDRPAVDVMDLALRFVTVHRRTYALLSLAVLVPLAVIALGAVRLVGWPLAWLVVVPLSMLAQLPFTVAASRLVFEERASTRTVLRLAAAETPRFLVGLAVTTLFVALASSLLVFPGFFVATLTLFLGEVMVLERSTLGGAFGRAQRVASSAMGDAIFGVVALGATLVASVAIADIGGRLIVSELLQFKAPEPVWVEYGSTLGVLGLFAQVPYAATARFFLYLNVRTRTEGWDIQTRFAAIAERARTNADDARAA